MPSLIRKEKSKSENRGTQTTTNNIVRHSKRYSAGTLNCTQSPIFSATYQDDMNDLFVKNHNALKPVVTFKCKHHYQEFAGLYALRNHENTQHGFLINTANVDLDDIIDEVYDANLEEELPHVNLSS